MDIAVDMIENKLFTCRQKDASLWEINFRERSSEEQVEVCDYYFLHKLKECAKGRSFCLTGRNTVVAYFAAGYYLTSWGAKEISVVMKNVDIDIPQEKNIAYIAAKQFYESLDFVPNSGASIEITKNIPMAAGLAGGSADAAAVLRGLNFLYGKPFTTKELCKLGLSIGSDIPFCIVGGVQVCAGKGEIVGTTFGGIRHYNMLVACGESKVSTAEQYKHLDEKYNDFKTYQHGKNFQDLMTELIGERCMAAFKLMYNIFEDLYTEDSSVSKIKKIMYDNEAKFAMMSGSGPAVFGAFPNSLYAEDAQQALAKEGIKSYICNPINNTYEFLLPGVDPWRC